ncbi:MAG: TlyA family RNA methyltransferase [bacterium]|nr:TlyA family RNA methyltransferase [bacterium]
MKIRLDHLLVEKGLTESRSQAENYIRLGKVIVDGVKQRKPGFFVNKDSDIKILQNTQYVSRAGLKLESVAKILKLDFRNKIVLDVGSSTGGFTDYALQNGAQKVIAVDVGTNQLHPKLRLNSKIELHEKTDIRNFKTKDLIDIVVIDVSFISLRDILPSIVNLISKNTQIVAMVKPQFEAGKNNTIRGVVKNNSLRRKIMQDFEKWCKTNNLFAVNKRDSEIKGAKGNQERFYILKKTV